MNVIAVIADFRIARVIAADSHAGAPQDPLPTSAGNRARYSLVFAPRRVSGAELFAPLRAG